jgi:mRNA interferase MazF
VVVSNQQNNRYGEVVEVIYLTTAPKRDLPTHVTIRSSGRVSTALCEQISTVSVERLGNYCGHVSDSELTAIENAMLISLGIQLAPVSEESEETPMPESRLAEVEARCRVLQELYDALLDRFVKAG